MTDPRIPRLAADWNRKKKFLIEFEPDILNDLPALFDTLDGLTDAGDLWPIGADRPARMRH